jgi:uncharacterized protein (DUF488 family)
MTDTLWTIGHSTRSLDEIASLLRKHDVGVLVDVRRFPRGKRQPHLSRENLSKELPRLGIDYMWMGEGLGGFRGGGYEAFMETSEFQVALEDLATVAATRATAVMCAEIVWFRCHRRFIGRALNERGWRIVHIVDERKDYVDEPNASSRPGRGHSSATSRPPPDSVT